jgi:NADPH:quinone reductase-like Zn-dependent oxidoreductase
MPPPSPSEVFTFPPPFQKALVQDKEGNPKVITNAPVPELSSGDMLVKTIAVALNPCDYKMGAAFPSPGAVIGNDFVGEVVFLHEKTTTRSDFNIGDIVCGLVHGSNPADRSNGAFAQYIRVPADLVLRVPREFKIEHAATLGSGLTTSIIALWEDGLGLKVSPEDPAKEAFPVLVYGASTSMGTMAVQLLRLSGAEPIGTCSPRNFDLVRGYGAKVTFDYADPETPARIKKETAGELEYVLDIITDSDSVACCYASISRFGGHYTCLELNSEDLMLKRRTIEVKFPMAFEVFGKELELSRGYERPASREKHLAAVRRFRMFQKLLDEGKLKAHPVRMLSPGFESILDGLKLLKSGSISGQKLVVPIS